MKKILLGALLCGGFLNPVHSHSGADIDRLNHRIDELEKSLLLSKHSKGKISSFESLSLSLGGYFNLTGTSWSLPHARNVQTFDEVEMGLMLNGQVSENLSFFSHIEFEQEREIVNHHAYYRTFGDDDQQVEVEDLFLTYRSNDILSFNFGALITPFGVSNREHFDFLRWQNEKPLALRENQGEFIFFDDHVRGFSVDTRYQLDRGLLESSLYLGSIDEDRNRFATGYRLGYRSEEGNLKVGTSFQTGQRNSFGRYYSFGLDMKARIGFFEFRSELFMSDLDQSKNRIDQNPISFYFEPWYHLVDHRHILYSRFDYLHDTLGIRYLDHDRDVNTEALRDPVEFYEYTFGYNFLPIANWRISLGVSRTVYVGKNNRLDGISRDFTSIEWGTVLSF